MVPEKEKRKKELRGEGCYQEKRTSFPDVRTRKDPPMCSVERMKKDLTDRHYCEILVNQNKEKILKKLGHIQRSGIRALLVLSTARGETHKE